VPDRPEIVCICGSTRFVDEMSAANRDLTFAGVIVVAPGVFLRTEDHEADESITNEQKTALDALHLSRLRRVRLRHPHCCILGSWVGSAYIRGQP
jgi:hypothetical protein